MKPQIFTDQILYWLGPWPITATMVTSALTSAMLLVLARVLARAIVHHPSGRLAAAGRLAVRFLQSLSAETVGRPVPGLEAFGASLFLFVAGAAVIGQFPGVAAPTGNLAAAGGLAALVFLAVPAAGIRARGLLGYLKHYVRPNPLLFPLHLISELSRTLALALRLFGNMMSGHLVVGLLVALLGLLVPVPLMALDLLIGFLQAYIFAILASVYIGAAVQIEEEERS